MDANKKIKLTQMKSEHGRLRAHKECLKGLGLRGIGSVSEVKVSACTLGMINKVSYMVKVEAA